MKKKNIFDESVPLRHMYSAQLVPRLSDTTPLSSTGTAAMENCWLGCHRTFILPLGEDARGGINGEFYEQAIKVQEENKSLIKNHIQPSLNYIGFLSLYYLLVKGRKSLCLKVEITKPVTAFSEQSTTSQSVSCSIII